MDDNANSCGEYGEHCYSFSKEHVLTAELTYADFVICHLLLPLNYQVFDPNVYVLVYYPSLILLDAILIPTVAEYCSLEDHFLETAVRNHAV
jgi:hypothetical protein